MYHTSVNTQVFFNKQISLNKDFVYDYSQIVNNNYVNTLTRLQKKIFNFIQRFRYCPFTKLTNETIARHTGCSRITVIRATNKFHQDGFITKYQQNRYAPNFFLQNDTHNKRYLILDNLFINSSLRTRARARIFKKNKGGKMDGFEKQFPNMAKVTQKRKNDGGHSPAIVKPLPSVEQQIHSKKVDIAFLKQQIENPESFWDRRSILFESNIKLAKSLLARAEFQLNELLTHPIPLSKGVCNAKQNLSYQDTSNNMETHYA